MDKASFKKKFANKSQFTIAGTRALCNGLTSAQEFTEEFSVEKSVYALRVCHLAEITAANATAFTISARINFSIKYLYNSRHQFQTILINKTEVHSITIAETIINNNFPNG